MREYDNSIFLQETPPNEVLAHVPELGQLFDE
jgi:hypothetical protein